MLSRPVWSIKEVPGQPPKLQRNPVVGWGTNTKIFVKWVVIKQDWLSCPMCRKLWVPSLALYLLAGYGGT